jgi:hypothetical protein
MTQIDYLRIYADADGCSHFETKSLEMASTNYAPPAAPLFTSALAPANNSVFLELPVGWYGDWHPTPVSQWLILMTGECEFEVGDGSRCRKKAGEVVRLDDTTGRGHCTTVTSDVPVRIAAIHLAGP